ncbi:hypothetical protein FS837_002387, partial [Tulasnella sp. UAMH 9824]
ILVNVTKEVVKELHTIRNATSVRSIPFFGGAPKSMDNEYNMQRRIIVASAVRRPTFIPSIDHSARPPRPAVRRYLPPKQPHHPAPCIEELTLEGRGQYSRTPGQLPVTRTHEREFMDERLLNIFLCGEVAYSPSMVYVPAILFDGPREMVKEF